MNKPLGIIPNILSLFRLGLAFLFPFAPETYWIWLILCGGASDFLDGWIARRWKLTSWQGGLIDAVADKCFVLAALITFALAGRFSGWLIPLVIARDLAVALIAGYAACTRDWAAFTKMDARWPGKVATTGQFLLMAVVALIPQLTAPALCLAMLISLVAAFDYVKEFYRELLKRSKIKMDNDAAGP